MAFTPLEPAPKWVGSAPVKVSIRQTRRGPRAKLALNPEAQRYLLPGATGNRFRVSVGRGDQHGQLLVVPDKEGPFKACELKGSLVLHIGAIPTLAPEAALRSTPCEYVEGDPKLKPSIIVTLPPEVVAPTDVPKIARAR